MTNRLLSLLFLSGALCFILWLGIDREIGKTEARAARTEGAYSIAMPGLFPLSAEREIPLPRATAHAGKKIRIELAGTVIPPPSLSLSVVRLRVTYDGIPGKQTFDLDGSFWDIRPGRIGDRPVTKGWSRIFLPERSSDHIGLLVEKAGTAETGLISLDRIGWTEDGDTLLPLRIARRAAEYAVLLLWSFWLAGALLPRTAFGFAPFDRVHPALLLPAAALAWGLAFNKDFLSLFDAYYLVSRNLDGLPPATTEADAPLLAWLIRLSGITARGDFEALAVLLSFAAFAAVGWAVIKEMKLTPRLGSLAALTGLLALPLFFGLPTCTGILKQPGFADSLVVLGTALALWAERPAVRFPAIFLAALAHPPLACGALLSGCVVRLALDREGKAGRQNTMKGVGLLLLGLLTILVATRGLALWHAALGLPGGQRLAFAQGMGLQGFVAHIAAHPLLFVGGLYGWLWPFVLVVALGLWRLNRAVLLAFLISTALALTLQFLATDWHRIFEVVAWPGLVLSAGLVAREGGPAWRKALGGAALLAGAGLILVAGILRLQ